MRDTREVLIRPATADDVSTCGQICFDAFSSINAAHGFPCDFPHAAACKGVMAALFSHPDFYCVVAEVEGRVVGSNCLDLRAIIAGVGPITVDPTAQNLGVGRRLMDAVLVRARERAAAGVRLVQAAFHNRSLSLYTSLGFQIREPLSCIQGRCRPYDPGPCTVRLAQSADTEACNGLARELHGFDRGGELRDGIQQGTARVAERSGRITGYATALAFFGHAIAETDFDLKALIASVDSFGGSGILVPSRNGGLLRWCLDSGLRIVQPMTLMSMGLYQEPAGAWLPSISL